MARKAIGDCIGSEVVSFSGSTVQTLTSNLKASKVLLQFNTTAAGIGVIGIDVMAYQPLVVLTENGDTPAAGYTGEGIGIFHMGIYEVEGANNIANVKIIPFATGYTVYCKILYYK